MTKPKDDLPLILEGDAPEPMRAPGGMDPGLRLAHRLDKLMAAENLRDRAFALLFLQNKYGANRTVPVFADTHCNAPPLG